METRRDRSVTDGLRGADRRPDDGYTDGSVLGIAVVVALLAAAMFVVLFVL